MYAVYIPQTDAGFDDWLSNFSVKITAAPATYGLVAGDATAIAAQFTAWHAAYVAAITPATRTSVTVAAKDSARSTALAVVRPYAQQISVNSGVLPSNKVAVGVNPRTTIPAPVPVPSSSPVMSIDAIGVLTMDVRFQDPDAPMSRAKPFGATAVQVAVNVGVAAITDPALASFYAAFTKIPMRIDFQSGNAGKVATFFARWQNRKGEVGPWSSPVSANVSA